MGELDDAVPARLALLVLVQLDVHDAARQAEHLAHLLLVDVVAQLNRREIFHVACQMVSISLGYYLMHLARNMNYFETVRNCRNMGNFFMDSATFNRLIKLMGLRIIH